MAVGAAGDRQAKRTDIQYVVAGAGSKDMIKEGHGCDKMIRSSAYPGNGRHGLEMTVATSTARSRFAQPTPIDATLVTKENAKDFYSPIRRSDRTSELIKTRLPEGFPGRVFFFGV